MPRRVVLAYLAMLLIAGVCAGCGTGSATETSAPPTATSPAEPSNESRDAASSPAPRPKLLPGARTRVLSAAGDKPYDKTFDDLRFEIALTEPFRRDLLTDSIEKMFGERIRIRGFILPTAQKSGLKQFVLVRDNQECCFGPGAAIYDCIFVEMQPGKTAEYTIRPVAVEGKFDFKEIVGPDGRHLAIYHVDGETVR